jgi:hypothetical protein
MQGTQDVEASTAEAGTEYKQISVGGDILRTSPDQSWGSPSPL